MSVSGVSGYPKSLAARNFHGKFEFHDAVQGGHRPWKLHDERRIRRI